MFRRITLLAAPIVLSGTIAHAATLGTPFLVINNVQRLACIVTNLGTLPADLSVKLFGLGGNEVLPPIDGCNIAPLDPNASCAVQAVPGASASCVIESSSGKVRAAVEVISDAASTTAVTVVPATAK